MSRTTPRRTMAHGLVYVLPLVHFCVCVVFHTQQLEWIYMAIVDFPVSLIALPLAWRTDNALLWFGLIGTAWWYVLSVLAWRLFRSRERPPQL